MKVIKHLILVTAIGVFTSAFSQNDERFYYKTEDGNIVYLPLGKISFADSIVAFNLGTPNPIFKYQDPQQALQKPNFTKFKDPKFVSLGCGGSLTVTFTDNGFMNFPGNDLYIFEVGPSREASQLEISEDGESWINAGILSGGKSSIDLSEAGVDSTTIYHYLRITDLKEVCGGLSAGADIDAIAAINSVIKVTIDADVLFDVAKFELKPKAESTLDSLAHILNEIDKSSILLAGHTDSDGSESSNYDLSYNRCYAVQEKLKENLKSPMKYSFEVRAFGEKQPKVPNSNDLNKAKNRRVEITILPPLD